MSGFSFGTPAANSATTSAPTIGFSFNPPATGSSVFGSSTNTSAANATTTGNTPAIAPLGSSNVFGTSTAGATAPVFGTSTAGATAPVFGTSTAGATAPVFGTSTAGATAPVFGTSTAGATAPVFGTSTAGATAPVFGVPATAVSTAPTAAFGTGSTSTGAAPATGAPSTMFSSTGLGCVASPLLANAAPVSTASFGVFGMTGPPNLIGTTATTSGATMAAPAPSIFGAASSGNAPGASGGGFGNAPGTQATGQAANQTITACPTGQMTFEDLEKKCNEWKKELELQEESFLKRATQINAWERLVTATSEKITELNEYIKKVKSDQERLDRELDFVVAQQKELEEMLVPLEKQAQAMQGPSIQHHTDVEREATYHSAAKVNAQLRGMADTIKDIIEHINASNRSTSDNSTMEQISKILNAHMDALQYIQNGITTLQEKTEDINKLMGVVRI
ncbi:nuclear pore glycoprotein p62-like [Tropilaelaps mercedesae]|uniref:Nuclear pore glycoprotein p62-like n=1 Tax=Tropilaelaps mercedesae TaxID=418985 RepID=A0A1V9XPI2_9ACAR|nr:nuclear pore glycoprotein p62-like [Tropilaelaps mercedesae]